MAEQRRGGRGQQRQALGPVELRGILERARRRIETKSSSLSSIWTSTIEWAPTSGSTS
ncbi:MAG: hypothetical protein R2716_13060 [Microthrixaceae bacterium]